MHLFDSEVQISTIHRISIPNDAVRDVLNSMGFEEHNGEMSLYRERYADADRILQVIEREELEDIELKTDEDIAWHEALLAIKALAEEIGDGTLCFYEE